jgi:YfiH family protein
MIRAPALDAMPTVRHAFFTREGGVSDGVYASLNVGLGSSDRPENVHENRARVARALCVSPSALALPYQVHSPDAVVVKAPWAEGERPRADAVVTDVPGLAMAVTTADCTPVLFADPVAGVVGAAHAGWRGALRGVLESTVAAMEGLGAGRERIVAVIGPTISADAYEVGPEFVARFLEEDADSAPFFVRAERAGHSMFDLPGYVALRLGKAGLGRAGLGAVEDLGLCTYHDEARFFSYRRMTHRGEPDYGRLVAGIALAG